MKKVLLLSAILVLSTCLFSAVTISRTGFQVQDIQSLRLIGNPDYLNAAESDDDEVVKAVQKLLMESVKATKPADAEEIALLTLESSQSTEQTFQIAQREHLLYIQQGEKIRSIPSEDFFRLAEDAFGGGLYRFTTTATPRLEGGSADEVLELQPASSTFSYRKINGQRVMPSVGASPQIPMIQLQPGEWPLLKWSDGYQEAPPDTVTLNVSLDGVDVLSGEWDGGKNFAPEEGGPYRSKLTAAFQGGEFYQGEVSYLFDVSYDLGREVSFSVEGADTYLGELLVIYANNVPDGTSVSFDSDIQFLPKFFQTEPGTQIALFPISYFNLEGNHYIELSCGDVTEHFQIIVKEKQFQIQNLTASESTTEETINSQKANAEYETVIAPLRPVADDQQYWKGKFVMPVSDNKVTTEFGMIRYVNGAPTSSRHGALDLAVPRGTPVEATNAGRVLYAGFLQLTGNTVLIEHGYGLKSWYYHMDSLDVQTGDMVEKSQVIGTVGSTGFSTGPHLHFGISVNNVFVNPYTIIREDLLPE